MPSMACISRFPRHLFFRRMMELSLAITTCFIIILIGNDFSKYSNTASPDILRPRLISNSEEFSFNTGREKLILNWAGIGNKRKGILKPFEGHEVFSECEANNCRITTDRSQLGVADAVILRLIAKEVFDNILPPFRPNFQQVWIFFEQEPSVSKNIWQNYHIFDKLINATMTYRQDSDIFAPRIKIESKRRDIPESDIKRGIEFRKRSKMVAWFVSKCGTQSRRELYVRELSKYIDIDIYGECGTLKCPKFNADCEDILAQNYKFYLSFENSICEDYVTEKLLRPLKTNTIPVVIGGANYSSLLPKGSYIDAKQFSPKELAKYLKKIASDEELYSGYISWTKSHEIKQGHVGHVDLCALCKYMNQGQQIHKVYTNLTKWWMRCTSPVDYYKGIDIGPRLDSHGFPSNFD